MVKKSCLTFLFLLNSICFATATISKKVTSPQDAYQAIVSLGLSRCRFPSLQQNFFAFVYVLYANNLTLFDKQIIDKEKIKNLKSKLLGELQSSGEIEDVCCHVRRIRSQILSAYSDLKVDWEADRQSDLNIFFVAESVLHACQKRLFDYFEHLITDLCQNSKFIDIKNNCLKINLVLKELSLHEESSLFFGIDTFQCVEEISSIPAEAKKQLFENAKFFFEAKKTVNQARINLSQKDHVPDSVLVKMKTLINNFGAKSQHLFEQAIDIPEEMIL